MVSFFGSGVSAACLYFITSSTENLVLSSVFESLSSAGISLMYCIAVELFPTEHRCLYASVHKRYKKLSYANYTRFFLLLFFFFQGHGRVGRFYVRKNRRAPGKHRRRGFHRLALHGSDFGVVFVFNK